MARPIKIGRAIPMKKVTGNISTKAKKLSRKRVMFQEAAPYAASKVLRHAGMCGKQSTGSKDAAAMAR